MDVKSIIGGLLLAAASVLSGCAAVFELDDALAIAPYRIENNGRIVVETYINDLGPFDFVLDTASSISAVFYRLSDKIELAAVPGKAVIIHGAVTSGEFPLLDIGRLAVGQEAWEQPRIVSLPGKTGSGIGVDGLLGVDFLRRYAVGFSTKDRVIRLFPPDLVAQRSFRGWTSVPLQAETIGKSKVSLYFLTVDIDGHRIRAVFDLGAGLNVINRVGARSLGAVRSRRPDEHVFSGALESTGVVGTLNARKVTTAGIEWRNERFSIADIAAFNTLKLSDRPAVILGAALFTQRDFVIDFVRNRLLVRAAMDEVDADDDDGDCPDCRQVGD